MPASWARRFYDIERRVRSSRMVVFMSFLSRGLIPGLPDQKTPVFLGLGSPIWCGPAAFRSFSAQFPPGQEAIAIHCASVASESRGTHISLPTLSPSIRRTVSMPGASAAWPRTSTRRPLFMK